MQMQANLFTSVFDLSKLGDRIPRSFLRRTTDTERHQNNLERSVLVYLIYQADCTLKTRFDICVIG